LWSHYCQHLEQDACKWTTSLILQELLKIVSSANNTTFALCMTQGRSFINNKNKRGPVEMNRVLITICLCYDMTSLSFQGLNVYDFPSVRGNFDFGSCHFQHLLEYQVNKVA
jgi:hypothetical protein